MWKAPVLRLEFKQSLPITVAQAWDFFSRPENLAEITPPDLGFEIKSSLPDRMYAGMIVTYRLRPFAGIAIPWTTEITHVEEPFFFVDEQRSGPYRLWHHQHLFAEGHQELYMTDIVHYQLSFGWLGHLCAGAFVRRRLERIFQYRKQVLEKKFGKI